MDVFYSEKRGFNGDYEKDQLSTDMTIYRWASNWPTSDDTNPVNQLHN